MEPQARIKSLCDQSNSVAIDVTVPLKRYYRSGMEMTKMAKVYEEERNYENSFILYMRYVTLFIEKIRDHPEYKLQSGADKTHVTKTIKTNLVAAERLKAILNEKYLKEYKEIVKEQKIIEEKLRKEQEERERKEIASRGAEHKQDDVWNNILITPLDQNISQDSRLKDVNYPTDSLGNREIIEDAISPVSNLPNYTDPMVPPRDTKPPQTEGAVMPQVDRGNKPMSLLSANLDQRSHGLRKVLIPSQVMSKFLSLASSNTAKNIETCGFLAGNMTRDIFTITHILVPQQVGFPDSCDTLHEEELYVHQDRLGLLTLGWIHTHPSQTAFLSSVDLHTHCSYQLMMPEAIAIVCAPKFNETGYFTLTPDYGMRFIANCKQTSFHPHPAEPPLFQSAQHIILDDNLTVEVIDLRR